jgi:hypothetical protein
MGFALESLIFLIVIGSVMESKHGQGDQSVVD